MERLHDFFNTVTAVTTVFFTCSVNFGKSNLTNLIIDVMFSGQRFAFLAMFFLCGKVA